MEPVNENLKLQNDGSYIDFHGDRYTRLSCVTCGASEFPAGTSLWLADDDVAVVCSGCFESEGGGFQ